MEAIQIIDCANFTLRLVISVSMVPVSVCLRLGNSWLSKKSHRYKTKLLALTLISIHQLETGFILYNQNQKILTESMVLFNNVMNLMR